MKVCYRCRAAKHESEFNVCTGNTDGLQHYCRECQKAHYRENAERHRANVRRTNKARVLRLRAIVFEAMKAGCVDCGMRDIRVLEFDHVRGQKVAGIGELVRLERSIETIRLEIEKCEVRCRNCHAIVTQERRGGSWHDLFR